MVDSRGGEPGSAAHRDSKRARTKRTRGRDQHTAPRFGYGHRGFASVDEPSGRPGARAESVPECKRSIGAENQLAGHGCSFASGLRHAQLCGAAVGKCFTSSPGRRLARGCGHDYASGVGRAGTKRCHSYTTAAGVPVARQHGGCADSRAGREGAGWVGGELSGAVEQLLAISNWQLADYCVTFVAKLFPAPPRRSRRWGAIPGAFADIHRLTALQDWRTPILLLSQGATILLGQASL